jgi:hypothetical protein
VGHLHFQSKSVAMNKRNTTPSDEDVLLDTFAAELTEAAYPIALKYGVIGSSLDLELEIWKTLTEVVRKRGHELLAALTTSQVAGASCS